MGGQPVPAQHQPLRPFGQRRRLRLGHIRVRAYDEALAVANGTAFGLSAGICTTSLKHATHFRRNAEAGMVMVNLPAAGVDFHVPFGGRKASSFGPREQGRHAAEFFTTVKTGYTSAL